MKHLILKLSILLLTASQTLAENQVETRSQGASCDGASQELGLEPIPGGFLELPAKVRHIRFARDIALCAENGQVEVRAAQSQSFSCADIRDSDNGGVGANFISSDGTPHHLWLYINPENDLQVLEIGLYREGTEIYWIVSQIAVCAGKGS